MNDQVRKKIEEISNAIEETLKTSLVGHYTVSDDTVRMITDYVIKAYDFKPTEYDIKVSTNLEHPDRIDIVVTKFAPIIEITFDI